MTWMMKRIKFHPLPAPGMLLPDCAICNYRSEDSRRIKVFAVDELVTGKLFQITILACQGAGIG